MAIAVAIALLVTGMGLAILRWPVARRIESLSRTVAGERAGRNAVRALSLTVIGLITVAAFLLLSRIG